VPCVQLCGFDDKRECRLSDRAVRRPFSISRTDIAVTCVNELSLRLIG